MQDRAQIAMTQVSTRPERPHVYLDDIAAARYLGFNNKGTRRLKDLRGRGGGPKWLRIGSAVRYRLDWLDAWADAHAVASTSEENGALQARHRPTDAD